MHRRPNYTSTYCCETSSIAKVHFPALADASSYIRNTDYKYTHIHIPKEDVDVKYLGSISTTSANLIQKRILIVMMKVVLSFQRKGNGKTGNGTKRK